MLAPSPNLFLAILPFLAAVFAHAHAGPAYSPLSQRVGVRSVRQIGDNELYNVLLRRFWKKGPQERAREAQDALIRAPVERMRNAYGARALALQPEAMAPEEVVDDYADDFEEVPAFVKRYYGEAAAAAEGSNTLLKPKGKRYRKCPPEFYMRDLMVGPCRNADIFKRWRQKSVRSS